MDESEIERGRYAIMEFVTFRVSMKVVESIGRR